MPLFNSGFNYLSPFAFCKVSGLHSFLLQACRQHLTVHQMGCMSYLHVNRESEPQNIVRDTGISKAHVYYTLHALEKQGIVQKKQKRRVALWSLTPKGQAAVKKWEGVVKGENV